MAREMEIIEKDDEESSYYSKTEFFHGFYHNRLDSENKRNYKQVYSAGILPFSIKGGTIYFLMGKDTENKWSDFGGRCEPSDRNRWDATATREFYEESIGSICDIPTMMSKLQYKKNFIKVCSKTLNGSPYYMYVVKIHYKDTYKETFENVLKFIRYTKTVDKKYQEKLAIEWVSIETLCASLDQENTDTFPLRKVFRRTLIDNFHFIEAFAKTFLTENSWTKPPTV